MKLPNFIFTPVKVIKKVTLKSLRGLRSIVSILSPRTLPGPVTVVVKGSVGYLMIQTSKLIRYLNPPENNTLSLTQDNNSYQPDSFESYLEKMGQILIVDGLVDIVKILAMVRSKKIRLRNTRDKLKSISEEIENLTNDHRHESQEEKYLAENDQIINLKAQQDFLNKYLATPDNLRNTAEDYQTLFHNSGLYQFMFEAGLYFLCSGTFRIETFSFTGVCASPTVTQLMSDNGLPPSKDYLKALILYFLTFGSLYLDGYYRKRALEQSSKDSIGNMPVVGTFTALTLFHGMSTRAAQFKNFKLEAGLFSSFDANLFKQLDGYQKMADLNYRDYYDLYLHTLKTDYSNINLEDMAHAKAMKIVGNFDMHGRSCLGFRMLDKNLYTMAEPLAGLYGNFKLYKNVLVMLENFLDLATNGRSAETPEMLKAQIRKQHKMRRFQAKLSVLRTIKPPRTVRPKTENSENPVTRTRAVSSGTYTGQTLQPSLSYPPVDSSHKKLKKKKIKESQTSENSAPSSLSSLSSSTSGTGSGNNDGNSLIFSNRAKTNTSLNNLVQNQEVEKLARKNQILANYHNCDQDLFRTILNRKGKDIDKDAILNFANSLGLSITPKKVGMLILVYKQHGASYHRMNGSVDPGFIRDFADAFSAVGISINDLDNLDKKALDQPLNDNLDNKATAQSLNHDPDTLDNELDETNENEIFIDCSSAGLLNSLGYVLTTRPSVRP